jgi:hypothetical protein
VRIGRRASGLDDKNVTAANVFVNLKVELTIRKTFGVRFAHVTTELATDFVRQRGIRISGEDFDAAGCAHDDIVDCQLPI